MDGGIKKRTKCSKGLAHILPICENKSPGRGNQAAAGETDKMADAAFKTAPFAGYTTDQLSDAAHTATRNNDTAIADKMRQEIYRRGRIASGDMTDATPGERLRMIGEIKA